MQPRKTLCVGDRVGGYHQIVWHKTAGDKTTVRICNYEIRLRSNQIADSNTPDAQRLLHAAALRALQTEAQELLPDRLALVSGRVGVSYKTCRIRRLKSRWGSCNQSKEITLSTYLIQLPGELVDYVLLHELNHTIHMHHQEAFWQSMALLSPNYKQLRKQLKSYRPILEVNIGISQTSPSHS